MMTPPSYYAKYYISFGNDGRFGASLPRKDEYGNYIYGGRKDISGAYSVRGNIVSFDPDPYNGYDVELSGTVTGNSMTLYYNDKNGIDTYFHLEK